MSIYTCKVWRLVETVLHPDHKHLDGGTYISVSDLFSAFSEEERRAAVEAGIIRYEPNVNLAVLRLVPNGK